MIISFGDQATEDLYHGRSSKRIQQFPSSIIRVTLRKLDMLNSAERLEELRQPLGNRLEALKGNWKGFFSIRINQEYRVVFQWRNDSAYLVSVVDYH